jgi:predicted small lipoprotein YifL
MFSRICVLLIFWSAAMRFYITLSIIVVLALPLQGCGKKGPLFSPPLSQTSAPQQPEQQISGASAPAQNKQP